MKQQGTSVTPALGVPAVTSSRSYSYHNAGLLANDGCATYEYDAFDRTETVQTLDPGTNQTLLDRCGPKTGN